MDDTCNRAAVSTPNFNLLACSHYPVLLDNTRALNSTLSTIDSIFDTVNILKHIIFVVERIVGKTTPSFLCRLFGVVKARMSVTDVVNTCFVSKFHQNFVRYNS